MDKSGFDYINVIPLVDVMLVLLTIVLTTSTFIAAGLIPVDLPKASASAEKQKESITIEIDAGGTIYLRAMPVGLESLKTALMKEKRGLPVLIRADKSVELQPFVDVLEAVKTLGFRTVSLQTEQRA
jgi:biopolymer transport protein ExbD